MRAQRRLVRAALLDVMGLNIRDAARTQVLGEDAADLAVADEADGPFERVR